MIINEIEAKVRNGIAITKGERSDLARHYANQQEHFIKVAKAAENQAEAYGDAIEILHTVKMVD